MSAPEYVPAKLHDQPRRGLPLPPARRWLADRPADLHGPQPVGRGLGRPGPDQGYALKLVHLFDDRLRLAEGEHREDVDAGCVAVALRRASLFGRAPVAHDLEIAYRVWGWLDAEPDPELVRMRRVLFSQVAHHYWEQREVADLVREDTLRMTPAQVTEQHAADWRSLLVAESLP